MIIRHVSMWGLVIIFVFLYQNSLQAEEPGFEFLRIATGARSASMAGAYIAEENDIDAVFYNPASSATLTKRSYTATYVDYLMDFTMGAFAYGQSVENIGSFALGITYMGYGDFEGRDEFAQKTEDFSASDYAIWLNHSRYITSHLLVGISGKYIQSKIADYKASAQAIDVGAIYLIPAQGLRVGATVNNLGTQSKSFINHKEKLPLAVKGGISKKLAHLPVSVNAELQHFTGNTGLQFAIGGEAILGHGFRGRLGYSSVGRDQNLGLDGDSFTGFSLGLGVEFSWGRFDYSLNSMGGIGSQNRLSVSGWF